MSGYSDLKDKVIIVAGAGGGGIGTACARMLGRAGAKVVAIDRSEEAMTSLEQGDDQVPHKYSFLVRDLMKDGVGEEIVGHVEAKIGPPDGLVNVVGGFENIEQMKPLLAVNAAETFSRLTDFNLKPALNMSIAAARSMISNNGGAIVQISSSTGIVSMPYGAGYAAAKAALINLTRTMAVEWGHAAIRVNTVACGTIMSDEALRWAEGIDAAAQTAIPLGRCGEPDEIASSVLFLLGSGASYISGVTLSVDGGALARAPYNDDDNIPVFITDQDLRSRLLDSSGHSA